LFSQRKNSDAQADRHPAEDRTRRLEAAMSGALDIQRPAAGVICISFNAFSSGTLRGFGDFHIAGWHFRILGCSCHRQNESRWVGLPSKPLFDKQTGLVLRDDGGKVKYVPVISFDDMSLLRRFSDASVAALDLYAPGWDR
jgi:hypothetical protein